MDCHAATIAAARNDRDISPVAQYDKKNGIFKKVDSRENDSKDCGGAFGVFYTFSKETSACAERFRLFSKETSLRLFSKETL